MTVMKTIYKTDTRFFYCFTTDGYRACMFRKYSEKAGVFPLASALDLAQKILKISAVVMSNLPGCAAVWEINGSAVYTDHSDSEY